MLNPAQPGKPGTTLTLTWQNPNPLKWVRDLAGEGTGSPGKPETTVMFFGMCNSPATFQSMMDAIISDMIDDNLVIIYMDNILIFCARQIDPC